MKNKLMVVLGTVLTAVLVDVRRFLKARKETPDVPFDWALAATTWIEGLIYGLLVQGAVN